MSTLEDWIGTIGGYLWSWAVLPVVVILGLYLTIRTGGVQIRLLPEMIRRLTDKTPPGPDGKAQSISAFQAFTVSAASRVGVGNIAGVGTAIVTGGPGAVFWMWLMSIIGAASAFGESTLAQIYKVKDSPRGFRGGPAYYIQHGLGARWAGVLFAVILIICFPFVFSALQANTISASLSSSLGNDSAALSWSIGIVLALMTAAVVFGGARRIASVTDKVVPVMALLYLLVGLVIVAINIENVPEMIVSIFRDAFTVNAVTGGAWGTVVLIGVQRGMFSNEAGLGSAPNAGAAAAVTHPVKQGFVQSLGVYFDTLLVCSITAFIVLSASPDLVAAYAADTPGIAMTQTAMVDALGPWAGSLLTFIIFLLAFSSILGNYFYGQANIEFITGENPRILTAFRVLVVVAILAGSVASASLVWTFADQIMGVMALVNLIAVALLTPVIFRALKDYESKRKAGIEPVYTVSDFKPRGYVEFWQDYEQVTGYPPEQVQREVR